MVVLLSGKRCLGLFAISDRLRPEAAPVIKRLKEMGIETILLTGASEAPAATRWKRVCCRPTRLRLWPGCGSRVSA